MDWTEILRVLGEHLAPVVATILAGVVSALGAVAVYYLRRWTGVVVTREQRQMLEDLAVCAVWYAEEQARKALKARDKTPDSDTKLETAVKFVAGHAQELGLPGLAVDKLQDLIEAALMAQRPPDERNSTGPTLDVSELEREDS